MLSVLPQIIWGEGLIWGIAVKEFAQNLSQKRKLVVADIKMEKKDVLYAVFFLSLTALDALVVEQL